jgi:hypothetical protein
MWMRRLPVNRATAVDPAAISAAVTAHCQNAVADLQAQGIAIVDRRDMQAIQSKLVDDISMSLSYIFFGEPAEA